MNGQAVANVAAFAALGLSLTTWFATQRRQRRDLFLSLHERLTSRELQTGRRIIWDKIRKPDDANNLERSSPEEFRQAVIALGMFDILGLYVEKGYVDRKIVMQEWGSMLARTYWHGRHMITDREPTAGWRQWPHFERLGQEALNWHNQSGRSTTIWG